MNPGRKIVVFSLFCLAAMPFNPAKTVLAGPPVTMTVNTTADTVDATPGDGSCADAGGQCSLRAAVMEANADPGSTILFASTLNGTPITLTRKGNDANAQNGDLDINANMTIQGNGPANTIVQGASDASYTNSIEDKIFGIDQDGTFPNLSVFISGMTIRYGDNNIPGNDPSWAQTGGGIDFWMTGSSGNSFTLSNCIVANNRNRNSYGGGMNIASDYYTSAKGTVQISNVTFQNNATLLETSGYYGASGGAINIDSGWDLNATISDSVFTGNTVTGVNNGGAICFKPSYTGSLAIHGCHFNNNSAGSRGGAVYIESLFNAYVRTVLIDQGTVFNGNISGAHAAGTAEGGGVYITSNNPGDSMVLSQVTLTNNAEGAAAGVKAGGGAIAVGNVAGTVRVEYSRIVGNTAGSGGGLHKDNSDGTVTAVNNWWGCNAGPGGSGCDTAAIGGAGSGTAVLNYNPWITLKHSAAPAAVNAGQTSTLTAGFLQNSAGDAIAAGNLSVLAGLPITFDNPVLGTLSGAQTAIQANGAATASFTAGCAGGTGRADARVDNQTVGADVAISAVQPNLSINDVTQAEGNSGTTTFTFTVSLSSPAGSCGVSFDIATAVGTAAAPSDFTAKGLTSQLIPAGSSAYTFDVLVNGDTLFEPNEAFQVNINNVTGAVVVDGQGTGTIMNDDDPPEMDLKQGATSLADGGTYAFGGQLTGSATDVVFTIENNGSGDLDLTTPVTVTGADADQFGVWAQPASPVAPYGGTIFTIRFAPTSTGAKTAAISIANTDSDENPYDLTVTGTATAPEMDLRQGATSISDGGSYTFGDGLVGSNIDRAFTIANTGTGSLYFTTPITITGADADQFSISVQPASPVGAGGGNAFTVRFLPTSLGAKTANISIVNTDSDENPYDLTVTGTGTVPEMNLRQGATSIADGGSHGFGSHAAGSSTDVAFTIANSGSGPLALTTPITLGGANADQFSIQSQPAASVAAGGSTTFTVRFAPTSPRAKTAAVSIANNDGDENPYDLTLTGTAVAPEMDLRQDTTPIADGDTHDFGNQLIASNVDVVFTIENSGTTDLVFTTPITITGAAAEQFSIPAQPVSPVPAGDEATFTVRFTPTSPGAKTAAISMANNDGDENPYELNLTGAGVRPEMDLTQGTTSIADGGTHNFGIQTVGSSIDRVFTIENTGTGPLTLTVPLVIGGVNADQFSVRSQPVSPVAAGGSTTFTVRFASTTDGFKTATIAVANNDSDENPYELNLTGTGFTPSTDPGSGGGGGGGGCFIGGASRGPRSGVTVEILKSLKDKLLQVRQWQKSFAAWRQRIFP